MLTIVELDGRFVGFTLIEGAIVVEEDTLDDVATEGGEVGVKVDSSRDDAVKSRENGDLLA